MDKKISLSLFLVIILILPTFAFTKSYFTVRTGISYSKFYTSDSEYLTGLVFGFSQNIFIRESNVIISFGGNYVQRGGILRDVIVFPIYVTPTSDVYAVDFSIKTAYLEIPALLKYKISIAEQFDIIPYTGVSFSFALSDQSKKDNEKYAGKAADFSADVTATGGDRIHPKSDYGFIVGGELQYKRVIVEISYYYGMNTLEEAIIYTGFNEKINSFQILIGYIL